MAPPPLRRLRGALQGGGAGPFGRHGTVHYRRFPLDEPFSEVAMTPRRPDARRAPPDPATRGEARVLRDAGLAPEGAVRLPEGEPVVMRFKGDVPAGVLVPHVVAMFFSMLIGVRAALAGLLGGLRRGDTRGSRSSGSRSAGSCSAPIVQKYAFGAFWTGWPFGEDLTDNKTLAMWVAWVVAVAVLARRRAPGDRLARGAVVGGLPRDDRGLPRSPQPAGKPARLRPGRGGRHPRRTRSRPGARVPPRPIRAVDRG